MNRRSLIIESALLGIWTDQAVEIARLEFVRVPGERFEIADAVIADSGHKGISEGQRAQRGVAPRAAAADRHALAVHQSARREVFRAVDAVVDIDDAPFPAKPLAVCAPIAGTAAIIHVPYRISAP